MYIEKSFVYGIFDKIDIEISKSHRHSDNLKNSVVNNQNVSISRISTYYINYIRFLKSTISHAM